MERVIPIELYESVDELFDMISYHVESSSIDEPILKYISNESAYITDKKTLKDRINILKSLVKPEDDRTLAYLRILSDFSTQTISKSSTKLDCSYKALQSVINDFILSSMYHNTEEDIRTEFKEIMSKLNTIGHRIGMKSLMLASKHGLDDVQGNLIGGLMGTLSVSILMDKYDTDTIKELRSVVLRFCSMYYATIYNRLYTSPIKLDGTKILSHGQIITIRNAIIKRYAATERLIEQSKGHTMEFKEKTELINYLIDNDVNDTLVNILDSKPNLTLRVVKDLLNFKLSYENLKIDKSKRQSAQESNTLFKMLELIEITLKHNKKLLKYIKNSLIELKKI